MSETCGGCKWFGKPPAGPGVRVLNSHGSAGVCYAMPPGVVAVMTPTGPKPAGARPPILPGERACGLFEPRVAGMPE